MLRSRRAILAITKYPNVKSGHAYRISCSFQRIGKICHISHSATIETPSLDAIHSLGKKQDWNGLNSLLTVQDGTVFKQLLTASLDEINDKQSINKASALSYIAEALMKFNRKSELHQLLLLSTHGLPTNQLQQSQQQQYGSTSIAASSAKLTNALGLEQLIRMFALLMDQSISEPSISSIPRQLSLANSSAVNSNSQISNIGDMKDASVIELEFANCLSQSMLRFEHTANLSTTTTSSATTASSTTTATEVDSLDAQLAAENVYIELAAQQRTALQLLQQHWPPQQLDIERLLRLQLQQLQQLKSPPGSEFITGAIALETFRFVSENSGLEDGVQLLRSLRESGAISGSDIPATALARATTTVLSFNRFPSNNNNSNGSGSSTSSTISISSIPGSSTSPRSGSSSTERSNNSSSSSGGVPADPYLSIGGANEERSLGHLPQRAVHELFHCCFGETPHEVLLRRCLLRSLAVGGHFKAAVTWLKVLAAKYRWIGLDAFHDLLRLNGSIGGFSDTSVLFNEMNKEKSRALSLPRKMGCIEKDYAAARLTSATVRSMLVNGKVLTPQRFKAPASNSKISSNSSSSKIGSNGNSDTNRGSSNSSGSSSINDSSYSNINNNNISSSSNISNNNNISNGSNNSSISGGDKVRPARVINFDAMLPPAGLEFGPSVHTFEIFLESVRVIVQQEIVNASYNNSNSSNSNSNSNSSRNSTNGKSSDKKKSSSRSIRNDESSGQQQQFPQQQQNIEFDGFPHLSITSNITNNNNSSNLTSNKVRAGDSGGNKPKRLQQPQQQLQHFVGVSADVSIERSPLRVQIITSAFEIVHRLQANKFKVKPTSEMLLVLAQIAFVVRNEKLLLNVLQIAVEMGKLNEQQLMLAAGSEALYSWQLNASNSAIEFTSPQQQQLQQQQKQQQQQNHMTRLLQSLQRSTHFEPAAAATSTSNSAVSPTASTSTTTSTSTSTAATGGNISSSGHHQVPLQPHQFTHPQIITLLRIATDFGRVMNSYSVLSRVVAIIQSANIVPPRGMINSIMKGYINARYYDEFAKLFESLPKLGITRSVADAMMLTEVFAMSNRLLDAWKAYQVVERMLQEEKRLTAAAVSRSSSNSISISSSSSSSFSRSLGGDVTAEGKKLRNARIKNTRHKRVLFKRLLDHLASRDRDNNNNNNNRNNNRGSSGGDTTTAISAASDSQLQSQSLEDASQLNYRQRKGAAVTGTDCGKQKISDEQLLQAIDAITIDMLDAFEDRPIDFLLRSRERESGYLYLEIVRSFLNNAASAQISAIMIGRWERLQHPRAADLAAFCSSSSNRSISSNTSSGSSSGIVNSIGSGNGNGDSKL